MKRIVTAVLALVLGVATVAAGAASPENGPAPAVPATSSQSVATGRPAPAGPPDHAPVPGHAGRPEDPGTPGDDEEPADGLRLNHLQARGTHNSTHLDPKGVVTDDAPFGWGYSHRTLEGQLEEQGVRQVEIDVHYNWAKDDFDVYHVWFGDDRATCDTLSGCLGELRRWSDAHPHSAPLMVMIEPKDAGLPYSATEGSTDPEDHLPEDGDPFTRPFDDHAYDRLDEVLAASFDGSVADGGRVLTPDDATAAGMTLRETITTLGWPLLDVVRGRVMFVLDGPDHAEPYSDGYTTLADRVMFVQAGEHDPVAAFVSRFAQGGEGKYERISRLVAAGFMVRDLTEDFGTAKAAGVHFISTDHPEQLHLSDDGPARCNPVTTTASTCQDAQIETHVGHGYPVPEDPADGYDQVAADKVDRLVVGSVESAAALAGAPPGERTP